MYHIKIISKEINTDVFPDLCLKKTRGIIKSFENTFKKCYFDLLKVEQNENEYYYKVKIVGECSDEEEQRLSREILDSLN